MEKKAIEKACALVGGQAALARLLGVTPAAVNQWTKGLRPVPAERCPSIERLTSGAVRCEQICPDVDWAFLRGTDCATESREAA